MHNFQGMCIKNLQHQNIIKKFFHDAQKGFIQEIRAREFTKHVKILEVHPEYRRFENEL